MGKLEQAFRAEIGRLARKEVRAVCLPVARQVKGLRRAVSQLSTAVRAMEKLGRALAAQQAAQKPKLEAGPEEVKSARLSPRLIRKLRERLGVTQAELAKLIAVSPTSVAFWEQGRNRPTAASKAALVAVRKLGRREVRRRLSGKTPGK